MFIGREKELNFLQQKYASTSGELIVLYGRRRVGKTETLREFCKDKPHVFYSCKECPDPQQLQAFSKKILRPDFPAGRYIREFPDWEAALESILDFPEEGKKLLVIDEFPYMCKANPSIPSILQNLWDEVLKEQNIMLILCGSSMSFVEKELLSEKNPLYGRATGIYKMTEMSFYEAVHFFPSYSPEEKIVAYAILGGIPHYLKQFDSSKDLGQNIIEQILTKGSILYSEIEFLLHQELRETALYNTIIEAIALGNTSLNDIHMKTQIDRVKINVYLKNLMELGIIRREFSISDKIKEQANSSRGIYKLTDHFFRFWYRFVYANFSELESGDACGVYEYAVKPQLSLFTSVVFEEVCLEYLRQKNRRGQLPFRFSKIGRWWGKITRYSAERGRKETLETEIDLMAMDTSGQKYLLGECKYRNSPVSYQVLRELQEKLVIIDEKEYYYVLFSKSGFTDEAELHQKNVCLVTLEELFFIDKEKSIV